MVQLTLLTVLALVATTFGRSLINQGKRQMRQLPMTPGQLLSLQNWLQILDSRGQSSVESQDVRFASYFTRANNLAQQRGSQSRFGAGQNQELGQNGPSQIINGQLYPQPQFQNVRANSNSNGLGPLPQITDAVKAEVRPLSLDLVRMATQNKGVNGNETSGDSSIGKDEKIEETTTEMAPISNVKGEVDPIPMEMPSSSEEMETTTMEINEDAGSNENSTPVPELMNEQGEAPKFKNWNKKPSMESPIQANFQFQYQPSGNYYDPQFGQSNYIIEKGPEFKNKYVFSNQNTAPISNYGYGLNNYMGYQNYEISASAENQLPQYWVDHVPTPVHRPAPLTEGLPLKSSHIEPSVNIYQASYVTY